MPHSGPCIGFSWFDELFLDSLREIPRFYARAFGIPTMLVNKASLTDNPSPMPVLPFVRLPFHFPGPSTICDGEGGVRDSLGDGEGIVAAEVVLDPRTKLCPEPPTGHWGPSAATLSAPRGRSVSGLRGAREGCVRAQPGAAAGGAVSRSRRRPHPCGGANARGALNTIAAGARGSPRRRMGERPEWISSLVGPGTPVRRSSWRLGSARTPRHRHAGHLRQTGYEAVVGDLLMPETLAEACGGVTHVYHLAHMLFRQRTGGAIRERLMRYLRWDFPRKGPLSQLSAGPDGCVIRDD
jgi:hypothetical protein